MGLKLRNDRYSPIISQTNPLYHAALDKFSYRPKDTLSNKETCLLKNETDLLELILK